VPEDRPPFLLQAEKVDAAATTAITAHPLK